MGAGRGCDLGCGCCYACRVVCRSVLLVCGAIWSVHFLRGEHHDRWYCQSTVVKSCLPDGLVVPRWMMVAVWWTRSQMGGMYGVAVFRRCCVSSCIHRQRGVGASQREWAVIALLGTSAGHGGESDCARHRVQPPQPVGRPSGLVGWLMVSGTHITGAR